MQLFSDGNRVALTYSSAIFFAQILGLSFDLVERTNRQKGLPAN